jgi:site-specific recombinase XerD
MTAHALGVLDGGHRVPAGWEALWERDVWRQSELPHGDLAASYRGDRTLRFVGLVQAWVKDAARRWARARLLAGTAPGSMAEYLTDLRHFSGWLAAHAPRVAGPSGLSRRVIEDYMLWVRTGGWKRSTQQRRIGTLRQWLDEQREDGLAGLPAAARIHGSEVPRIDYRLPKELPEDVFGQLIAPGSLARLAHEWHRTAVLLLAWTGLRASSVVTLARDALTHGPDGHPYLRYANIKLHREAILPIPPPLGDQLARHERWLTDSYPAGTPWLLPSPMGDGARHVTPSAVARMLKRYVELADVRDAEGRRARIYPHLFRHHLGTSMVNDGVPLTVIQKVLDHQSIEMTARYAQLQDDTLRRELRQWHERVNVRGERIALPVDGPLEEAAWMKERIARARQALPNGYCGLPLVQTCPHPNACLSCDNFLTDGSFRQVHTEQLDQTRALLARARENNRVRLVEVLERDQASLTRILDGLDAIDADHPDPPLDLRDLAGRSAT